MTPTVRGYVFGAWSILTDQGHLPRDRGSSSIFDDIEAAAKQAGCAGDQHGAARAWLNRSQLSLFDA